MSSQNEVPLKGDHINDHNQKLILITDIMRAKRLMGYINSSVRDFDYLYEVQLPSLEYLAERYAVELKRFIDKQTKTSKP
jgi:hypothetical protein